MTEHNETHDLLKVLIVGGGVAMLEAALAIHELAGDRVPTSLLVPNAGPSVRSPARTS